MKPRRAKDGMGLLELAEASLHQVRLAPLDLLTPYYVGSMPFALAILYFWADMIQGATAWRHIGPASLGVAAAFVWMKCWQAVYCARMRAALAESDTGRWGVTRVWRLVSTQAFIHATSFVMLPVAAVLMVPFGHVYAFYHNATVFGADEENAIGDVVRRAWSEAKRWPGQNHKLIWIFSPIPVMIVAALLLIMIPVLEATVQGWSVRIMWVYVTLICIIAVPANPIGMLVALNMGIFITLIPVVLKSIFGIETAVSIGGSTNNSTFFMICVALTYLCLDPLLRAGYTLRCFHGESLSTGEDLRVALKRALAARVARRFLMLAIGAAILFTALIPAAAQSESAQPGVQPQELDRAISTVLDRSEYQWRMPKEVPETAFEDNLFTRFLESVFGVLRDAFDFIGRFVQWLFDKLSGREGSLHPGDHGAWMTTQSFIWSLVLIGVLAALAIIIVYILRQRRTGVIEVIAAPVPVTPNLEADDVTADALPEDGWLSLAREMMQRGDLRLAMRALFLATLASLSHRELIRIVKSKSNREYVRELERRAHALAEVPLEFSQSVRAFERVWYGDHPVDSPGLDEFSHRQERIRTLAKQQ